MYHERRRQVRAPDRESRLRPTSFASLRLVPHFTLFVATVFGLQLVDRSFGPVLPLYLVEIGLTEHQRAVLERHAVRDDGGRRGDRQPGDAVGAAGGARRPRWCRQWP